MGQARSHLCQNGWREVQRPSINIDRSFCCASYWAYSSIITDRSFPGVGSRALSAFISPMPLAFYRPALVAHRCCARYRHRVGRITFMFLSCAAPTAVVGALTPGPRNNHAVYLSDLGTWLGLRLLNTATLEFFSD